MTKILTVVLITFLLLVCVGVFLAHLANYNAAQEDSASAEADVLYTFLIKEKRNWCFSSPEIKEEILKKNPLRYGMKDPWENNMKIYCSSRGLEKVCSFGLDGVEQSEDDICVDYGSVMNGKKRTDKYEP